MRKPLSGRDVRPYLLESGSLTKVLQAMAQRHQKTFRVSPTQSRVVATATEARILHLGQHRLLLKRDVFLFGDNQAWVFAQSLIPYSGLRGPWRSLAGIGSKPLGAILFSNPRVTREPHSYKKVYISPRLSKTWAFEPCHVGKTLWARRAIFTMNNARLSVTEIFLPDLLELT